MPGNVVSLGNMRKHMTKAEKSAREEEEQKLARPKVKLTPTRAVKNDVCAYAYWKTTLKRMKDMTLLDDLDSEMLSVYCLMLSRRDQMEYGWRELMAEAASTQDAKEMRILYEQADFAIKRVEAQERNALSYAEKLGLTPSGRVRLAKKRAEERTVDPEEDLYGGN